METFKKLKQFYWPYKNMYFWSLFFLLFVTLITVVYPVVLQFTIDEVVLAGKYEYIPYVVLGFIGIMIVKGITTYFQQYLGDMFGITSVYRLRNELYKKLQFLPFRYYDNAKTGDFRSRLTLVRPTVTLQTTQQGRRYFHRRTIYSKLLTLSS